MSTISATGWFKVFNKKYIHFDHHYSIGLNVLNSSFPDHSFYFTDAAHLLDFLGSDGYLHQITLPIDHLQFKWRRHYRRWESNMIIVEETKYPISDPETFLFLESQGMILTRDLYDWVIFHKKIAILKLLFSRGIRPKNSQFGEILRHVLNGDEEMIDLLYSSEIQKAVPLERIVERMVIHECGLLIKPLLNRKLNLDNRSDVAWQIVMNEQSETLDLLQPYIPLHDSFYQLLSQYACKYDHVWVIQRLIEFKYYLVNISLEATKNNSDKILKLILDRKMYLFPDYLLLLAVREEPIKPLRAIKVLLDHGAQPTHDMVSQNIKHYGMLELLLPRLSDINYDCGRLLLEAIEYSEPRVVELLLQYGADIHVPNDEPLRLAIREDRPDMIRILLDHGALVDGKRWEFVDFARASGKGHLITLFF